MSESPVSTNLCKYSMLLNVIYLIADKWNPSLNSYIFWDKWNWEAFHMFKSYLYFSFCEFSSLSFLPSLFPSFFLPTVCSCFFMLGWWRISHWYINVLYLLKKQIIFLLAFLCQCKFFFFNVFFFNVKFTKFFVLNLGFYFIFRKYSLI